MKFLNINLAKTKKGVSIIELLIVISVIGIMASTISVVSSGTQKSARDAKRKEDAELILNALTAYASKHGGSFKDIVGTPGAPSNCNSGVGAEVTISGVPMCQALFLSTPHSGGNWDPGNNGLNDWNALETYLKPYIGSSLPKDPKNNFIEWAFPCSGQCTPLGLLNFGQTNFKKGFYLVAMVGEEVSGPVPCTTTPITLSYYFLTAPEDPTDPLTIKSRYPTASTSGNCNNIVKTIYIPR